MDKLERQDATYLKARFWKQGDCFVASDTITLRDVRNTDKEGFLEIQKQNAVIKSLFKEEIFCKTLWEEHIGYESLMCSIDVNGVYVGYCGIKNLTYPEWEIVIEILRERTKQGIGYAAVNAFVHEVKEKLGVGKFRVRIDPENIASQKLFEKLGAVPDGISEFMLHNEEKLKQFEEENLHLIDEKLMALAEKFGVEPRRLLSHVLEYKLVIDGDNYHFMDDTLEEINH